MFISTTQLSKLMKEAYKGGGIRIGNIDGGLIVFAGYWGLWIDENYIPNKVKAIVMELSGELPGDGKVFKVSKEEAAPQYELTLNDYFYINHLQSVNKEPASKTGVIIDLKYSEYELLQINRTKRIALINRKLMDMIDVTEINYDIEGEPSGPCTGLSSDMFFWRNATCTLLLLGTKPPEDNAVISALTRLDFEEEAKK